jgi:16S rRNA (guanine527-N7)-methyltransferase
VRDERLERWLDTLLSTPGLTSIHDRREARRVHLEESLAAVEQIAAVDGPIVDVGSGGGAPGIPVAAAFPEREVTLLEANRRKCLVLERLAGEFPNVRVVRGRAEEQAVEQFGVVLAKALAPPPVAAEWCLPLARVGGAAILYVGPSAARGPVDQVAEQLGARLDDSSPGLFVLRKVAPTPPGFPRRPGVARKRPLA